MNDYSKKSKPKKDFKDKKNFQDKKKYFKPKPKVDVVLDYWQQKKVSKIKQRLFEMREYKNLLAEEGLEPDADDKRLESENIIQLLRIQKGLSAKPKPKPTYKERQKAKALKKSKPAPKVDQDFKPSLKIK